MRHAALATALLVATGCAEVPASAPDEESIRTTQALSDEIAEVATEIVLGPADNPVTPSGPGFAATKMPAPNSGLVEVQFEREAFLSLLANEITEMILSEPRVGKTVLEHDYYLEAGALTFSSKALLEQDSAPGVLDLPGQATIFLATREQLLEAAPLAAPAVTGKVGRLTPTITLLTNPLRLEIREDQPLLIDTIQVPPFVREIPLAMPLGDGPGVRAVIHASSLSRGELPTITLRVSTNASDDLSTFSPWRIGPSSWGVLLSGGVMAGVLEQQMKGGEGAWWPAAVGKHYNYDGPFASAARESTVLGSGFRVQANVVPKANFPMRRIDLSGLLQVQTLGLADLDPGVFTVEAYKKAQAELEASQGSGSISIGNIVRNDENIFFTGFMALPPSPQGRAFHLRDDEAIVDDDGVALRGRVVVRRGRSEWSSVGMGYGRCSGQPTPAQVTVTSVEGGRQPRLVAPVEAWYGAGPPPIPRTFVRPDSKPLVEVLTGERGLRVQVSWEWRKYPTVSVVVATNVGVRRAVLQRPPAINGIPPWVVNWSECHPPTPQPLQEITDCWMCQVDARAFAAPVVLPGPDSVMTTVMSTPILTAKTVVVGAR